jgi:hypothetical protein
MSSKRASGLRIGRRQFVQGSAALLLAGGCGDSAPPGQPPGARVAEIHDPLSVGPRGELDAGRVQTMLRAGLLALTRAGDLRGAWRVLVPDFTPDTRIGIKVNCTNYRVGNSVAMMKALIASLTRDLGASQDRIIVWDRSIWELATCQLTPEMLGVQTLGTIAANGGAGYDTTSLPVLDDKTTRLSRILSQRTDVTINVGVAKDHDGAGITGALKNVYGAVENPAEFHDDMTHALPALFDVEPMRKAMRLHILESFLSQAEGGPVGPPTHTPGRLLLSADPVAMDSRLLSLINSLRASPVPSAKTAWLQQAEKLALGSTRAEVVGQ